MDKTMQLSEELNMADSSEESRGEQFMGRVASTGLVLKFKLDKHGAFPSESTIPLQEVKSSDKENARDQLDNSEVRCAQNVIPLLEQSEIGKVETKDAIPLRDNAKVAHTDEGINRAEMLDNSTNVVHQIASLESIAVDNAPIRINETSSSENAKMDNIGNVIAGKNSPENLEVRETENDSGSVSDVHICDQCGKSFKKISSLHGHMGSHRREDNKRMRRMQEQPIPMETSQTDVASLPKTSKKKKPKFKHDREVSASEALVEMSGAPVWHPKYSTATIDLSTSVTFSSDAHSSGETAMMREAAEILTTLVDIIHEETVKKVASPLSARDFVCTTCNKTFSSYHALGGHMSIHNKSKKSLLKDSSGSTSGCGERCTRKYVRRKCNKRFPTGQSFGGHKRKHCYEEHNLKLPTDGNGMAPMPLPHENVPSAGTAILPTDEKPQPTVLLGNENVQPASIELVVENANVHQPLPQDFDAVQQPQQANMLGNETEPPSGAPTILVDTTADLSASRRVLDLNMLPPETDGSES